MYVVENRKKERRKNDLAYIECKPCRFILRNPTKVKKNWCKKVVDEGVRRVDEKEGWGRGGGGEKVGLLVTAPGKGLDLVFSFPIKPGEKEERKERRQREQWKRVVLCACKWEMKWI